METDSRYYALCASAALLKWVQTRRNIIFTPNSLRISYTTLEGTMQSSKTTADPRRHVHRSRDGSKLGARRKIFYSQVDEYAVRWDEDLPCQLYTNKNFR